MSQVRGQREVLSVGMGPTAGNTPVGRGLPAGTRTRGGCAGAARRPGLFRDEP